MAEIVSPYGDTIETTTALTQSTPVAKLAYEFCTEFNVQVTKRKGSMGEGVTFNVLSVDGIPLGNLYTQTCRNSDGNNETVYFYNSQNIVSKAKGTARSDSYTRDANKIKSLLTVLKKNKEIPEVKSMYKSFAGGIRYAFQQVSRNREPDISIRDGMAIALIEHVLLDKLITHEQNEHIKSAYKEYQSKMKSYEEAESNGTRFSKGAKLIGICGDRTSGNHGNKYYLVGEASYDTNSHGNDGVIIHGDLKRYNSLKDNPEFSADVVMINAYMQGRDDYDNSNEFGLSLRDTYYTDIDVATGYASNEMWILIPKTAP
jgi:hypothetical protein